MKRLALGIVLAACGGSTTTTTTTAQVPDAATPAPTATAPVNPIATADCTLSQTSNLANVAIRFTSPGCTFTLAQAKAGITITYEVDIAADVAGVIPGSQASTPQKGPSGLDVFERLTGNGQHYCLCDVGLGFTPPPTPETLKTGTYPSTFKWDGRNWDGPSDTGNPEGATFPAGDYDLDVSASGTKDSAAFTVDAHFRIRLEP